MPMASTPSQPFMVRQGSLAQHDSRHRPFPDRLDARDLTDGTGTAVLRGASADRPTVCPATVSIEDQRERAQQEFKQIWNLYTLTH